MSDGGATATAQVAFLRRYSAWKKEQAPINAVAYASITSDASDPAAAAPDETTRSADEVSRRACMRDAQCAACLADPSWECAQVHSYVHRAIYAGNGYKHAQL